MQAPDSRGSCRWTRQSYRSPSAYIREMYRSFTRQVFQLPHSAVPRAKWPRFWSARLPPDASDRSRKLAAPHSRSLRNKDARSSSTRSCNRPGSKNADRVSTQSSSSRHLWGDTRPQFFRSLSPGPIHYTYLQFTENITLSSLHSLTPSSPSPASFLASLLARHSTFALISYAEALLGLIRSRTRP